LKVHGSAFREYANKSRGGGGIGQPEGNGVTAYINDVVFEANDAIG
jgi:hypothetical protein